MKDGTLKTTEPICQTTMNAISDTIEERDQSQRVTQAVVGLAVRDCACDGLDDGLVNVVDMSIMTGAQATSCSTPTDSKMLVIRRVYAPNSDESRMARRRGRGRSMVTISSTRPGLGVMTTTRSLRKTASGIEWVTKTIVFGVSCQNFSRSMLS